MDDSQTEKCQRVELEGGGGAVIMGKLQPVTLDILGENKNVLRRLPAATSSADDDGSGRCWSQVTTFWSFCTG